MLHSDVIKVAFISVLNAKYSQDWRQHCIKGCSTKARGHFLLHLYNFGIPFLTFTFFTFPPLSTNLSKKISRCKLYILIVKPSYLFLEESVTISITTLILFLLVLFHIHIFKIRMLIEKRNLPTRDSDVIIHFLLCCVSFPSLLPFPCKEL